MGKVPGNDANGERQYRICSLIAALGGCLLPAAAVVLLAGCAVTGKGGVEAAPPVPVVAAEPSPSLPKGPSVVHFSDGREGFEITEQTAMDPQLRADFHEANAMIRDARYEKAVELLEKVVEKSPGTTAPCINLAMAYMGMEKAEQAEEQLKKALGLIPGHPVAGNHYGLLLRKAGRFAESRKVYEESLAVFPEYYPIHRNLGILCDLYLKDYACAVEQYEIYSKAMPKDKQVKMWIADLHARMGRQ